MTLANKITIFRIVLIIAFMVGFAMPGLAWAWASLLIFALACASDYVDGYIARNFNQVTTFGKFMDPLADKLLVIAALVCFVGAGIIPAWIAVVIICRDMLVDMMRTIAVSSGKVVAANWWGKWKTAFQMFAIISFLLERVGFWFLAYPCPILRITVSQGLIYIAVALTVISGVTYMKDNWKFIEFK